MGLSTVRRFGVFILIAAGSFTLGAWRFYQGADFVNWVASWPHAAPVVLAISTWPWTPEAFFTIAGLSVIVFGILAARGAKPLGNVSRSDSPVTIPATPVSPLKQDVLRFIADSEILLSAAYIPPSEADERRITYEFNGPGFDEIRRRLRDVLGATALMELDFLGPKGIKEIRYAVHILERLANDLPS